MYEQVLNTEEVRKERFYRETKKAFGIIFDKVESRDRKEKIKKELLDFVTLLPEDERGDVMQRLENLELPDQRDEFIEAVFQSVKPVIDLKFALPVEFEVIQRKRFDVQHPEFTKVNQLFSIEIRKGTLHLHVPANETTSLPEKLRLLKEAFHKIAEIVKEHSEIEKVQGETWILNKDNNPGLAEKLGFTIIDKEKGLAYISREDFLKKYS